MPQKEYERVITSVKTITKPDSIAQWELEIGNSRNLAEDLRSEREQFRKGNYKVL